jgi:enamine deaminase RidA (YjgF/YER057c/UK114 family)
VVSADFISQFQRALENVIDVVWAAGGRPADIARMVVYVTDKSEYTGRVREIGEIWRARMGRHYPAMVLVEVKGLLDDEAKVEIEAMALL